MNSTSVAIYARYSTDKQDARSIEDQLRKCHEYAVAHGMTVVASEQDAATSGAGLQRSGLQRLLAAVRLRRVPISAVIVDDLSRLSRDLGDTWTLVFRDFAAGGVRVIGVADGVDSFDANARLNVGMRGLINDAFIQDVRKKTHRGLEGRALAGFHTGGSCYGYTTEPEKNPADPEHARKLVKVEQDEARVVRRIFDLYAEGAGLVAIAQALNAENVPAPQDSSPKKKAGRGWSKNQLHSMLRNERYIGRIVWNRREWFKVDGRRRYRERPESEWKVREEPALAIIDAATWAKVQRRNADNARGAGRPGRTGYFDHALSGLLRCGACGSPIGIVGQGRYGCSARYGKGAAICANGMTAGEARLTDAVLEALRRYFASPEYERWLRDAYAANERARVVAARRDDEVARLDAAVRSAEARVEKVTEAIARIGYSEPLEAKLRGEEAKLLGAKNALALATVPANLPPPPPAYSSRAMLAVVEHIGAAAKVKPQKAKELLRGVVESILLTPKPDGYGVRISLKSISPATWEGDGADICETGCGGASDDSSATPNPSFPGTIR